jgi:hypothetical protein
MRLSTTGESEVQEETAMNGQKTLVVLAVAALGFIGGASALASDHPNRGRERGYVLPCSLDGVNPAYHPEIFGNPAAARSYGFVLGTDRVWRVMSSCRR